MALKFSTGLPNGREGRQHPVGSVKPEWLITIAKLAEELGYHALWPNEFFSTEARVRARYADPPTLFDPIVTLAQVAAHTKRIRLVPSTIVLPLHEPLLLSRQVATLDVFSGGRVTLGIGLGGTLEAYRRLLGTIERPNRGKMMEEYLQAMRLLWTERRATFKGQFTSFEDVETFPKPIQNPLPIFVAGHAEGVFRRIAAHGHGWINSFALPDDLRADVEKLHGFAAEAGRGDVQFEIARQFVMCIGETEEEAKATYAAALPPATRPQPPAPPKPAEPAPARPAPEAHPEERLLVGSVEQIRNRLKDYVAAGITEVAAIFCYPTLESGERQLRLFAEQVMPALSSG
jgi:probable F420-dependent oxidoreductase